MVDGRSRRYHHALADGERGRERRDRRDRREQAVADRDEQQRGRHHVEHAGRDRLAPRGAGRARSDVRVTATTSEHARCTAPIRPESTGQNSDASLVLP